MIRYIPRNFNDKIVNINIQNGDEEDWRSTPEEFLDIIKDAIDGNYSIHDHLMASDTLYSDEMSIGGFALYYHEHDICEMRIEMPCDFKAWQELRRNYKFTRGATVIGGRINVVLDTSMPPNDEVNIIFNRKECDVNVVMSVIRTFLPFCTIFAMFDGNYFWN